MVGLTLKNLRGSDGDKKEKNQTNNTTQQSNLTFEHILPHCCFLSEQMSVSVFVHSFS